MTVFFFFLIICIFFYFQRRFGRFIIKEQLSMNENNVQSFWRFKCEASNANIKNKRLSPHAAQETGLGMHRRFEQHNLRSAAGFRRISRGCPAGAKIIRPASQKTCRRIRILEFRRQRYRQSSRVVKTLGGRSAFRRPSAANSSWHLRAFCSSAP